MCFHFFKILYAHTDYTKGLAIKVGQRDRKGVIYFLFTCITQKLSFPCCKPSLAPQSTPLTVEASEFSHSKDLLIFLLSFPLHLNFVMSDLVNPFQPSSATTHSVTTAYITGKPGASSANSLLTITILHKLCHSSQHNY